MIEFTIEGQCYSLKNTRDIFPIKAEKGVKCPHCRLPLRMMTVPNAKAKVFEKQFERQIPPAAQQNLLTAVRADIEIYYPTNLQDLDESLVFDLMQSHGVLGNDRQIVSKYINKHIDPDNPRVEVKVIPVIWDRTGKQPSFFDEPRPVVEEAMSCAI